MVVIALVEDDDYSDGNDDDNDGENAKRDTEKEKFKDSLRCEEVVGGKMCWRWTRISYRSKDLDSQEVRKKECLPVYTHNLGIDTNHQTHLRHSEGLSLQITIHPLTTLPTLGQVFVTLSIFHAHYKVPQPDLSAPSAVML